MPWADTARRDHARPASRYASDLTNREWTLIAPFLPPPRQQGRPRSADLREVMNAILYMARRAASGACCRRTCLRPRRCSATSMTGATADLTFPRDQGRADLEFSG